VIPANRHETALGTAEVIERMKRKTLTAAAAKKLPAPISRPKARTRIWDGPQIDAYIAGEPLPALPDPKTSTDPEDLLDELEAVEELHRLGLEITPNTWHFYLANGYGPVTDAMQSVCGVLHFYRGKLKEWLDNRPGAGAGAGRPEGAKDSRPRQDPRLESKAETKAMIARYLQEKPAKSDTAIVALVRGRTGLTESWVYRLLREVQDEANR
jgi:hypothetical protein